MAGVLGKLLPKPKTATQVNPRVEETLNNILSTAIIPPTYIDGVSAKLRIVLQNSDPKIYDQLVARASHPCVKEYLPQVFQLLQSQEAQVAKASSQLKGEDLKEFLENVKNQKDVYYTSIAELLGKGFTDALRPNLIFDASGNPIGVKPKDQMRFPACQKALATEGGRRRKTKKTVQKKRKTLRRVRHKVNRNMHRI